MIKATTPHTDIAADVATVNWSTSQDSRPALKVKMGGKEITALVDTGANLSVMAEDTFRSIFGDDWVGRGSRGISVAGISGEDMQVMDYVETDMQVLDRHCRRPFVILRGMANHTCILGCDFLTEEKVIIDGATKEVSFKEPTHRPGDWRVAEIKACRRTTVFPRTIQHVEVEACVDGHTLPPGQEGVVTGGRSKGLTIWGCISKTAERGKMTVAVVNMTTDKIMLKGGDELTTMTNAADVTMTELTDNYLAATFGTMKPDKLEAPTGRINTLTKAEEEDLKKKLNIKADAEWRTAYEDLFLEYIWSKI